MSKIKQFSKALSIVKGGLGGDEVLQSLLKRNYGTETDPEKIRDLMMSALEIYDETITSKRLLKLYSMHCMIEEMKDEMIKHEDELELDLAENRYSLDGII